MDALMDLLSRFSLTEAIIAFVAVCLAVKALWDLTSFFWSKLKIFLNKEQTKQELLKDVSQLRVNTITKAEHEELIEDINLIKGIIEQDTINNDRHEEVINAINKLNNNFQHLEHRIEFIDKALSEEIKTSKNRDDNLQEYQLASTRRYLVDAHHLHCYDRGFIDEQSLDSLEKLFDMYSNRGGNSYIENCMRELRSLPRISNLSPGQVSHLPK